MIQPSWAETIKDKHTVKIDAVELIFSEHYYPLNDKGYSTLFVSDASNMAVLCLSGRDAD